MHLDVCLAQNGSAFFHLDHGDNTAQPSPDARGKKSFRMRRKRESDDAARESSAKWCYSQRGDAV